MNKMTPKAAEALELSILKWKENTKVSQISDAKIYADSCPLCKLFVEEEDEEERPCFGCPVREYTGRTECGGSPWSRVQAITISRPYALEDFRAAAEAEVAFLSSLREKPGAE
jgi:hypothetical protein